MIKKMDRKRDGDIMEISQAEKIKMACVRPCVEREDRTLKCKGALGGKGRRAGRSESTLEGTYG